MLVACLLLLVQAGATGINRPAATSTPGPTPSCSPSVRVALVTDVGGTHADGAAYQGMMSAVSAMHCASDRVVTSAHATDYARNLQLAVDQRDDLVIGGSFLLSDAITDVARANPSTRFMLVDPLVAPGPVRNLTSIQFRRDQNAFLAGVLAGLLTKTGIVAGIYGPGDLTDRQQTDGFTHGAEFVRPGIRVLTGDQPADDGTPYANPAWGESQARAFAAQDADVIFAGGGATGIGALRGAVATGRFCIGVDLVESSRPSCLVGNATTDVGRGVYLGISAALSGAHSATVTFGLRDAAVGLQTFGAGDDPGIRQRLAAVAALLRDGAVTTGA